MSSFLDTAIAGCTAAGMILFAPAVEVCASAQSPTTTASAQSVTAPPHDDFSLNETPESWAAQNQPISAREFAAAEPMLPPEIPHMDDAAAPGPPALISSEELRHPLSRKGRDLLVKAQNEARKGNHSKAIEGFTQALKERSAEPYAHGMLGIEYLRTHRIAEAIAELQKASEAMPRLAAIHSNLGFALCASGQSDKGLQEIEMALRLDQSLVKARFLEGVIRLDRGSYDRETWNDLQLAQKQIPTAHLALAIYYARDGQEAAAQQQLQEYVSLGLGISTKQAEAWLGQATSGVTAGEALGLWTSVPPALVVGQ